MTHASSNLRKYRTADPFKRILVRRFTRIVADTAAGLLPADRPGTVLDAGCGEGFILAELAARRPDAALTGIDRSSSAIGHARLMAPAAALVVGEVGRLPFPDRSFDVALAIEVLEHLPDPAAALAELVRVTRSALVLSVPNEPWFRLGNLLAGKNLGRFGSDPEHIQHWTVNRFEHFISTQLAVERVITTAFPWTIVVAKKTE